MSRLGIMFVASALSVGCGHRYAVIGESDTNRPIGVSIMKVEAGTEPVRLYYTELTGNDTTFRFDERIGEPGARVEAWFELKGRAGPRTTFAIPPDERTRVKLDVKDDRVVVEETRYGKEAEDDDNDD